jgi:hypothetical protein
MYKKTLLTIFTILFAAVSLFAQSKISARCVNDTGFTQGIFTQVNGNLLFRNCPTGEIQVSNLNSAFKLQDPDYIPFAGSLNADVLLSNASNNNVQNDAGLINTSNHFVSFANDIKLVASGASKWHIGLFNQIRVSGAASGSGNLIGSWDFVNNRGYTGATPYVVGKKIDVNLEGDATESVGIDVASYKGSAVSNPLFIGGRFTAANGYTDAALVTGVESVVRTVSTGATIGVGRGLYSRFQITSGHTVTAAIGLSVSDWTNAGTAQFVKGIFIDNTVNGGTISSYALESASTAPSYFSGNLSVNGAGKFYITTPQTPLSATDTCTIGQQAWDTNFYYVCTATNNWKRAALSTW